MPEGGVPGSLDGGVCQAGGVPGSLDGGVGGVPGSGVDGGVPGSGVDGAEGNGSLKPEVVVGRGVDEAIR